MSPKKIMKEKKDIDPERAKKIKLLDKIDNMRVVQNNHLIIGKFEESIKVAEEIIVLAKEAKLISIVNEQKEFIKNVGKKIIEKNKSSLIKDTFEILKNDYEKLLSSKKIIDAHKIVTQFKDKYGKTFDLTSLPSIKVFLLNDDVVWEDFTNTQQEIKNKIKELEKQFQIFLKKCDFSKMSDTIESANNLLSNLADEKTKLKWETYEKDYLDYKRRDEILKEINKSIDKSSTLKEKQLYKEAILEIDNALTSIKDKNIPEYQALLTETRKDLIIAETKYNKLYLKLAEYKGKFRENQENDFLNAAIKNCENIIQISQLIGMTEVEKDYTNTLDEIKGQIRINKSKIQKELDELTKRAKEIEGLIKIDDDVLPIVEEFSVKELLGDLSNNPNEMLQQIGTLMNEYRVEVKKDIINEFFFTTNAGEVIENKISREALQSDDEEVLYQVRSGLRNTQEDTIEKAVITDLIPYNFEISDITFNGELIKEIPSKKLTKEGVELKWDVQNLAPKKRIQILYNLRQRIPRTIIFLLEEKVKIIKTHSNLNRLTTDGLYEAKLPLINSLDKALKGVIVEDIIPPSKFLQYINEPSNLKPNKSTSIEMGEFLRWNIGTMEIGKLNYHYTLLELNKFVETKKKIESLTRQGMSLLNKGKIIKSLSIYKEIRNQLLNSIK